MRGLAILISLLPICLFFVNAETILTKIKLKEWTRKRRDRLDKEHGIDREEYAKAVAGIDKKYRISERENLRKMWEAGQGANYASQQEQEIQQWVLNEETIQDDDDHEIKYRQLDTGSQIAIEQKIDAPDPWVHGAKIIFDSRLDNLNASVQLNATVQ